MGYYPHGGFICSINGLVHFEMKDSTTRVVLWSALEDRKVLDLTKENFELAFKQMREMASIMGIDY